jgi:hypothetical protein
MIVKFFKKKRFIQGFPFFKFLITVSGRLVPKIFLPFAGIIIFAYYFFGHEFFTDLVSAIIGSGFLILGILSASFTVMFSFIANRRIGTGLNGWIRHLPIDQVLFKWIIILVNWIMILPLLFFMGFLSLTANMKYNVQITPYLIGLPFLGLSSVIFNFIVAGKRIVRILMFVLAVLLSSNNWLLLSLGLIFIPLLKPLSRQFGYSSLAKKYKNSKIVDFMIGWRAMRLRLLIPYLASFLTIPFLYLFISNNPLEYYKYDLLIRLSGGFSLVTFSAVFSHLLGMRRPIWAWYRSLSKSSRNRILTDSLFITIHLVPILLIFGALSWEMFPFLISGIPPLVFYSTLAIRRMSNSGFGTFGYIMKPGILVVMLTVFSPWIIPALLIFAPLILHIATKEEKELPVSQFHKVSYLAIGDSRSWSGK